MSTDENTLDLVDWQRNGSYPIDPEDAAALATATDASGLCLARIDLSGCADKTTLLERLSVALRFPDGFGHNWDALSDNLRDLEWLPAAGYVLLFEHAERLCAGAEDDFAILIDILDDAAAAWSEREVAFFAFLALTDNDDDDQPEDVPDERNRTSGDSQKPTSTLVFELEGDYIELNQLLKLAGLCDSGGAGKAMVARGVVSVDGVPELRKTCKIRAGQEVAIGAQRIIVRPI